MGTRFKLRSKCLIWPNVRSQSGVNESSSLTSTMFDARLPLYFTSPDEGRDGNDNYRRSNEMGWQMGLNASNSELRWENSMGRKAEVNALFDNPETAICNEPIRDNLFED